MGFAESITSFVYVVAGIIYIRRECKNEQLKQNKGNISEVLARAEDIFGHTESYVGGVQFD